MFLAVVGIVVLGVIVIESDELIDDTQTPVALRHSASLVMR
ncbi:hypothetical protein [Lacticaseibacillus hulanensis]|nr:hypothetical protein [Lacticaseibacillus hulanensis]